MKKFDVFARTITGDEWITEVFADTMVRAFEAVKELPGVTRCMGYVEYSIRDGRWVITDRS